VFSTLHTNDAAGAVARMLYMGIEAFLLTSSLIMTQAQRLYRRLCNACKVSRGLPSDILKTNRIDPARFDGVTLYQARGCPKCFNTGYKGRNALMEILLVNDPIRELILKESSAGEIRDQAIQNGMLTLRETGLQRVAAGDTSLEEVLLVTSGE